MNERKGAARILIVDDEEDVIGYLTILLSRGTGFIVESTMKPLDALERVEKKPFDVVLSDIGMPEMRGTDLAKRIQAVSPTTRIILMSGDEPAEVAKAAGVFDFLQKPIARSALLEALERAIHGAEAPSADPASCSRKL